MKSTTRLGSLIGWWGYLVLLVVLCILPVLTMPVLAAPALKAHAYFNAQRAGPVVSGKATRIKLFNIRRTQGR